MEYITTKTGQPKRKTKSLDPHLETLQDGETIEKGKRTGKEKKSIRSNSAEYQKMKKRATKCVYILEAVVMLIDITKGDRN